MTSFTDIAKLKLSDKSHLIIYEEESYALKVQSYIKQLKAELEEKREGLFLLAKENDELHRGLSDILDSDRIPTNTYFGGNGDIKNSILGNIHGQYAIRIGNKTFGPVKAHLIITFDLDTVQIHFLEYLKRNSELTYHLFMKREYYESNALNYSHKEILPKFEFEVIA